MYNMYNMNNDTQEIDWEDYALLILNCLEEQKTMIQELSQKVDELGKYSKESENCINFDTEQSIADLTNRVSQLEAFDVLGLFNDHEKVLQIHDKEISKHQNDFYSYRNSLNKCKDEVRIALDRTNILDASVSGIMRKLQGIKR